LNKQRAYLVAELEAGLWGKRRGFAEIRPALYVGGRLEAKNPKQLIERFALLLLNAPRQSGTRFSSIAHGFLKRFFPNAAALSAHSIFCHAKPNAPSRITHLNFITSP
jgi:hypothetical protein